jgi:hypothetical protein
MGREEEMALNGNKALGLAVAAGGVIATIFGMWISAIDGDVTTHDDKGFHEGVRELVTATATAEREWNEDEHWKQEQRFDQQFVEVRAETGMLRKEVAEAITLLRVLEERTRPPGG